ncbi:hypothetical protein GTA26_27120 [Rhodococcus hoagii]|nr:hypothetical protein [Prescottella equi]
MEHNSSPHQLTIGRLHGLPLIHSDAIRDNQLNLAKLGAQAAFSLRGWQFMDAGQFITVYIEGVKRGAIDQKITLPVVTDMAVPGAALELAVGSVPRTRCRRWSWTINSTCGSRSASTINARG